MSRLSRLRRYGIRTGVLAAVLALFAPVVPASAQEPVTAEDMGWYTSASVAPGGLPVGDPVGNATFEEGDLPVGAVGQEEHKRSYLRVGLPEDVVGVRIELPLSDTEAGNYGAPGPILACPVTGPFSVTSGGDLESAPEVDCSQGVEGEPDADLTAGETATAYHFDLTPLLPLWEQSETPGALALVADVSEPQGLYQVTFFAELFGEIGTAQRGDGDSGEPIVPPPPDIPDPDGEQPPVSEDTPTPSGSGQPPASREEPLSETDEPAPPVAAPPPDAGTAGGDEPVTQEVVAAVPPPAPVRIAPWLLALPLAAGGLIAAGSSLRAESGAISPLDRVLGS